MKSEINNQLTVGSMFAGIGGICLAFKQNGCNIIWANDIDKHACKTYRLNFGDEYLVEGDVQNINVNSVPSFDILTAGFPCQAFSSVGLQHGFKDPRGNLFFETARIINAIKPKVVFLENVANLVKHDYGKTFEVILKTLADLGYYTVHKVMNAKEYGNIPQQRNRIYIVAFRYKKHLNKFSFPEAIPLTQTAFDLFDKEKQNEKYYMDGHRMWERIPFFYDGYSVRLMTPHECARVQGFPEDYRLPKENEKQVYKQIGNSVCVPVVYRTVKNIVFALS